MAITMQHVNAILDAGEDAKANGQHQLARELGFLAQDALDAVKARASSTFERFAEHTTPANDEILQSFLVHGAH